MAATSQQDLVDLASRDAVARLRGRVIAKLTCKEAEELLDGNFRANDIVIATLQQAWDCTVSLDCQLSDATGPEKERNKCLQSLAADRMELLQRRAALEIDLLTAKLEVQNAAAGSGKLLAARLADVLDACVQLRASCIRLGEQLEILVREACQALRALGVQPLGLMDADDCISKKWRAEFNFNCLGNNAMLKALQHPGAARAVPASALEERIDYNWKFLLELVGLLEKTAMGLSRLEPADINSLTSPDTHDGSTLAELECLLHDVEAQLPALLECKYLAQEAAAMGKDPDVDPMVQCTIASQRVQREALKFLTAHRIDVSKVCLTKFAEEMLPHPAAFGSARSEAYNGPGGGPCVGSDGYPSVIRFLTYNIFLRVPAPTFGHNNGDDKKDERLHRFSQHLPRFDVVCLQEAFGAFTRRQAWLTDVAQRLGFEEVHHSPTTGIWPRFLVDGGLLMLSRLPVVRKATLTFEPGVHLDRLFAKGALYSKLQCGLAGPYLHICTTHLQSTYSEDIADQARIVRSTQLARLVKFLEEETRDIDDGIKAESSLEERAGSAKLTGLRRWPLLICGTLNINGRTGPMDGASSKDYIEMVELLRSAFGEMHDLLLDVSGSHPVTYADTRLTGVSEVPAERVLTNASVYRADGSKRQRLDYLFFFPSPRESASLLVEPVVPATCQVERFLVDRSKDVGAPITQLSDHYGVAATLAVVNTAPSSLMQVATVSEASIQAPIHRMGQIDEEVKFVEVTFKRRACAADVVSSFERPEQVKDEIFLRVGERSGGGGEHSEVHTMEEEEEEEEEHNQHLSVHLWEDIKLGAKEDDIASVGSLSFGLMRGDATTSYAHADIDDCGPIESACNSCLGGDVIADASLTWMSLDYREDGNLATP